MAEAAVRPARAEDVPEIARIQRETWRLAYAELLGVDVLRNLDGNEAAWAEALAEPATRLTVATEGQTTVGFSVAGPSPAAETAAADGKAAPDAASTGLIGTLLVEPRWGRRGHGGRLLVATAAALWELGATRGIAWIAETDVASLSFYANAGWQPDGTVRTLDADGRPLREVRVTGDLALRLTP